MKSALELVVGIVAVPRGESGLKSKYHRIRDCQPLSMDKITKQRGKSKHVPGLRYREASTGPLFNERLSTDTGSKLDRVK